MTLQFFQRYGGPSDNYSGNGAILEPAVVEHFYFPGGEPHIRKISDAEPVRDQVAYLTGADGNELMALAHWVDYINDIGTIFKTHLIIPYLPGARADRGAPLGAWIYAQFINRLEFDQVICLDPHSEYMPANIENVTTVYSYDLIRTSLGLKVDFVISPDEGSRSRSKKAADALGVPVFNASKHRDMATGKLSGFTCEELPAEGLGLIVDDICDGGGTFMGLAEATGLPKERLALFVTHGIFSGAAAQLKNAFSRIITTDSFPGAALSVADTILPVRFHLEQYLDFEGK